MRAHHRHVAGVVADTVVLLEAHFMRFIDNDQAQLGEGQEQRRARTDHHLRGPARHRPPSSASFGRFERGVPQHRRRAEAILEAFEEDFGQRNLWQQHQHLAPHRQRLGDGLEIGLGLARPRDPVEQEGRELGFANRLAKARRRRRLIRREIGRGEVRARKRIGPVAIDLDRFEHPLVYKPAQHPFGHPCDPRQLADRRLLALQRLDRRQPLRRHPLGQPAREAVFDRGRCPLERATRTQRHPRHRSQRRAVIIRRPLDQPPQRRGQGRNRHNLAQGPQFLRRNVRSGQSFSFPDDPDDCARTQRASHDRTRANVHALGHAIVERAQGGIEDEAAHAVHRWAIWRTAGITNKG